MQTEGGEQAVEEEEFVAEGVARVVGYGDAEGIAQEGGNEANEGNIAVTYGACRKDAVGKEAKQRAIGVANQRIEGIEDIAIAPCAEE